MALMDLDPADGTSEADELALLALLIEHYEREHLDQMGLTRKDLARYMGPASKVSEVLNGKHPLSLNMIRKLSASLGISADTPIREPAH